VAKKGLLVLVIAALVAGGAFAQIQMSAGAGMAVNFGRLGGMSISDPKTSSMFNHVGFGGFLFFDATYAELSLGFGGGGVNQIDKSDGKTDKEKWGSVTTMDIGLLGKYPISLGSVSVAPLLGFAYNIVVGMKDKDGKKIEDGVNKSDFNTFRLQAGVGTDISINENLYVRIQGLGHYRFASKFAKDLATLSKLGGYGDKVKANGGFGGTVTAAVGYKF